MKAYCVACPGSKICKKCKLTQTVKDGLCTACQPDYVPSLQGISKEGSMYLTRLKIALGINDLQYKYFDATAKEWKGSEYHLPEWRAKGVDGKHIDPHTEQVILEEYLGEDVHGHPGRWGPDEMGTDRYGRNRKALFYETERKMHKLKSFGYRLFYAWCLDVKHLAPGQSVVDARREFIDKLEWQ